MKLSTKRGTTSKLAKIFIQNSTTTDGAGLTGLTSGSAGLTAYYIAEGANAATAISLSSGTLGTWSSGGFIEVDATNLPGVYELGIPNAALAAGNSVVVMLKGATNMAPCLFELELDAIDYQVALPSVSDVKAQVVAALATDTQTELTTIPGATPTLVQAIMLAFMALRNQVTSTATQLKIRKDDGTVVGTSTQSDDGTTFTRSKFS